MASAYVPPPPEEDFVGFSTQQEDALRQVRRTSEMLAKFFLVFVYVCHSVCICSTVKLVQLLQNILVEMASLAQQSPLPGLEFAIHQCLSTVDPHL